MGKRSEKIPGACAAVAKCVVCGCTDNQACVGGCAWVVVNYAAGRGLCSACEAKGAVAARITRGSCDAYIAKACGHTASCTCGPSFAAMAVAKKIFPSLPIAIALICDPEIKEEAPGKFAQLPGFYALYSTPGVKPLVKAKAVRK